MGWVERKPTANVVTKPTYIAGDRIPRAGTYYMSVFTQAQDTASLPAHLTPSPSGTAVYFVGDSRTMYLYWNLENFQKWIPKQETILGEDKVQVIAESGQGLRWFKEKGFGRLKNALKNNEGKVNKHIVIMNLGVNDAGGVSANTGINKADEYVQYMRDTVVEPLNNTYGNKIEFYYMSVNPLCSQAIKDDLYPNYNVTEQDVVAFNNKIKSGLCSGSNSYFTYLDTYDYLMRTGWFPAILGPNYDGIHYKECTCLRIYNYCMDKVLKLNQIN